MRKSPKNRGFTYAMVLAAIVILGIVLEAARVTTWRIVRADREAELIFRGLAYRDAVRSFHEANGVFPRTFEDLVKDPRSVSRRHIRALYADPVAKDAAQAWRIIRAPDGGIAGVASATGEEPLKQANFPLGLESFTGAKSYAEWIFEYRPPLKPAAPRKPV